MQLIKLVIQDFINSIKQFILNTNLHKIYQNTEGSFLKSPAKHPFARLFEDFSER